MMQWTAKSRLSAIAIGIAVILVACGDGSNGSPVENPSVQELGPSNGGGPASVSQVNGNASGRLFLVEEGEYLDLDTGSTVKLSNEKTVPRPDGLEFLEIFKSGRKGGDSCGDEVEYTRINIRNMQTGLLNESFLVSEDLFGDVLFSPDGQTIAYTHKGSVDCGNDRITRWYFRTRTGELTRTADPIILSAKYLSDGRLIAILSSQQGRRIATSAVS